MADPIGNAALAYLISKAASGNTSAIQYNEMYSTLLEIYALRSGAYIQAQFQTWMESLSGYDSTVDNLAVVRDHDGVFRCKIVTVQ